jgi:hypothetical protein
MYTENYPTSGLHTTYILGSLSANDLYVGEYGEVSIDVSNWRIRVHDNVKLGGWPLENEADLQTLLAMQGGPHDPDQGEIAFECISQYITQWGVDLGNIIPGRFDDSPWCPDLDLDAL